MSNLQFEFRRSWIVPAESQCTINEPNNESFLSLEHKKLSDRFELLTKKFEEFISRCEEVEPLANKKGKGKGKGKGKSSKKSLENEINIEAEKRLRRFLAEQNESHSTQSEPIQSTSRAQFSQSEPIQSTTRAQSQHEKEKRFYTFPSTHSECWSEDRDNSERNRIKQDTKTIFIRRIDCLLNANPIDQIEDKQSEDECIQAYFRLFAHNGQMNTLYTNSISYDDFR
jgi:hypothetical protein